MRVRSILALAPVLVVGLVSATYAQMTKAPPPPPKLQALKVFDPTAPPVGPSTTKDMLKQRFDIPAIAGTTTVGEVELWGAIVGGSGFTTMDGPQAAVWVRVRNPSGVLPAGRYRVRYIFSNVSQAMTIGLLPVHAGASGTCNLVQKGGYYNTQTCDVWFTAGGAEGGFDAKAVHNGTFGQFTLHSVQIFKET